MMQADVIPAEAAVDFDSDSEGDLPVAVVLAEAIFVEDGDVPHLQAVNDQHPRRDELLLLQQQQRQDDPHNADLNHPVLVRYSNLRGRISSYLFDMIREECTCTSILSGWSPQLQGCNRVVDHCHQFQEEAFYVSPNGRTALHEACLRGSCTHVLEALLQANSFGAMDRDHHGNTPLHLLFVDFRCAVSSQEMDAMVQQLVAVNPALLASSINMDGSTALHMACTCPETMISSNSFVRLLQASPSCATKLNGRNQTPLLLHCQRRNATTQVAQILLQANPDALTILDGDDGWAPLHYAASHANVELVQYLVQTNPQAARVRTLQSFSALHLLCRQSLRLVHLPAMDALLRADPDSVLQQDAPHSYTPLHLLCRSPRLDPEFAKRLVQTNPHAAAIPDADNYLPLHHACDIGSSFEIVSLLLQTYPEAACQSTRKQDSALSLACACNQSVETVRLLIDANHHALLLKNDYGFCALHCVCRAYQPRMGIVQALLEACPSCVTMKTHAGETPVHLACSNSGAFVGVLQLLTMAQNQTNICDNSSNSTNIQGNDNALVGMEEDTNPSRNKRMTNKIGNTPLHDACFRGSPFEHIETLAMANPEWILVRNNAGYSPLQILCKNGRISERIVTTFSRIGGPEIFSVIDGTGNSPLHSAMREDTDVATLKCLIRALPDALHLKTIYGDSPLHLACFRRASPDVVREVALASSDGRISPVLEPNTAGQTPIAIAMEEFRSVCRGEGFCCVISEYRPEQKRAFQVLATLAKILYYGPNYQEDGHQSLIRACVSLHRQDVRLDPAFIRRAIHLYPEDARVLDEDGNYPLHIEASIPVEKMPLLDAANGCCHGLCHKRMGILRMLLEVYPEATRARNNVGEFPLGLMIQNGRLWGHTIALALRAFPPALHWYKGLDDRLLSLILEKASKECGTDTLFALINSRPDVVRRKRVSKVWC